jgi:hypothetical protein
LAAEEANVAAPAPPLDAVHSQGDLARFGRHDHIVGDGPVLLAALDDVAGQHEDLRVRGQVFDGKSVDLFRLMDDDLLLGQGFLKGEIVLALEPIRAVDQEDTQVLMGVWTRERGAAGPDGGRLGLSRRGQSGNDETEGERSPRRAPHRCERLHGFFLLMKRGSVSRLCRFPVRVDVSGSRRFPPFLNEMKSGRRKGYVKFRGLMAATAAHEKELPPAGFEPAAC